MATSLFSFKNLLLVTGSKLNFADYLSLTVLTEVLKHQGVNVELAGINPLPEKYTSALAFPEVKILDKMPARKFVLTFDKDGVSVKNVQWQQTDQQVSIHISMEKGEFKADKLNVTAEGTNYDAILYFNVSNFDEVKGFFEAFPTVVYEVPNLSLGEKFAIENAKVEILDSEVIANLPENIYNMVKTQGSNGEQHTRLLAAIFIATNRFRANVSKSQTFTKCAELLNSGANLDQANSLVEVENTESQPAKPNGNGKFNHLPVADNTDPLPEAKSEDNSHTATQVEQTTT
jgi:hypothetical protein